MTSKQKPVSKGKRSRIWYLLPIFLHIIGGVVAYYLLRADNPSLARKNMWLGIILSATVTTIAPNNTMMMGQNSQPFNQIMQQDPQMAGSMELGRKCGFLVHYHAAHRVFGH